MGKALRGYKGKYVLNAVQWAFQHQRTGDIFDDYPEEMRTSFPALVSNVYEPGFWDDYCNELKPDKWVRYDEDGNPNRRRSPRQANRARERSYARETLRRQLVGTKLTRRPEPEDMFAESK